MLNTVLVEGEIKMNIKRYLSVLYKIVTNKDYRFFILADQGYFDKIDDEKYLKRKYKACIGKELNLDNTQTFNEKLQWLKLHDRKPEYTMMVDKYAVRKYIADTIGEEYLIPLLGVWDNPDDIDFDALPNQFVLKCNHNSGLGMCICKDKSKLDIEEVKAELRKGLQQDYYLTSREWPYKNVSRKIVCEEYMEDWQAHELIDYKFMCFNGEVKCSFTCSERFSEEGLKVTFFDKDWNIMPFERHYPASKNPPKKPINYDKMIQFSEQLSKEIPFVRVDFYEINGQVFFGELTFYPGSGFEEFTPEEWDYKLGDFLKLKND